MTIKKRPMTSDGTSAERRKTRRFPVVIPIEVSWRGKDGISVKEEAVARQVNANGGFVKMSNYPELGSRVTLANFLSAQTAEARVLAAPESRQGVANGIVVELTVPNESFWGVDLQVNKTILELKSLETALKSEDIDVHLMREYRGAVENIRTITETLQHLRKCQSEGSDSGELLSILAGDRIHRITNLCLEAVADVDASQVEHQSEDVDQLKEAMQLLLQNLKQGRGAAAASPRMKKDINS
ncbi:MAG TPA: hypothetical protein VGJ06_15045 [Candidatus Acidoferrum sp.]